MSRKLLLLTLGGVALVALLPELIPTGPTSGLDASQLLASGQLALGAGVIFAGGLLTALTPCVYPLIPITVSVFGATQARSRGRAVLLTSSYVLGMGVVFAMLGVIAARTGALFGSVLADPRFIVGLALFLLVLASSMFGAFEIALPQRLTQRLSGVGGAGVPGAFLMGSVAGFLAAPCTGPVLTGLLAFVARSQSSLLGGALLFIYALGVGVPFFVLGVFTVRLPKGGQWMEWVKSVLGIALVALAASYLKDALPPLRGALNELAAELGKVPGAVLATALAAIGLVAGAIHLSFKEGGRQFALKAAGVVLVVGAILLRTTAVGAPATGEAWVRLGWAQPAAKRSSLTWQLQFSGADPRGLPSFDTALARARAEGRPVMIDFFAEWCAACKELDHKTYVAEPVVKEADRFVNIKVDGTNEEDVIATLYERFGVLGLPTVAFVGSDGKILEAPRVTGFLGPDRFAAEMKKVR
jgi:thiol:disulfide interchange protein DsbD